MKLEGGKEVPNVEIESNHSWQIVNLDVENKIVEIEILD